MNKQRRKAIAALQARLSEVLSELETLRDDEQSALDNLPQSLQDGDKGQAMQEAVDALDGAITACEECDSALGDASR